MTVLFHKVAVIAPHGACTDYLCPDIPWQRDTLSRLLSEGHRVIREWDVAKVDGRLVKVNESALAD